MATDSQPFRRHALVALVEAGAIRVYSAHWDSSEDEQPVTGARAVALLRDRRFYDPKTEPDGQRVWFINVKNLVNP